jgi:hypothetical protein
VANCRPAYEDDVWRAAREGLAHGLREHLPGAVGIVTKGVPLCAVGTFAHLVLGASVSGGAISAALAGTGVGGSAWLRARRSKRLELPPDVKSFTG